MHRPSVHERSGYFFALNKCKTIVFSVTNYTYCSEQRPCVGRLEVWERRKLGRAPVFEPLLCSQTHSMFSHRLGNTPTRCPKNTFFNKNALNVFFSAQNPVRGAYSGYHGCRSSVNFRGGHKIFARKMCIKNHENAQILNDSCPKNYNNTRFLWYLPEKLSKYPNFYDICLEILQNSRILHDFLPEKCTNFT